MEVGTPYQVPLNARNFYAFTTLLNYVLCVPMLLFDKNDTPFGVFLFIYLNFLYIFVLEKFQLNSIEFMLFFN